MIPIGIAGIGSISALGSGGLPEKAEIFANDRHYLQWEQAWIGKIPKLAEADLSVFQRAYPRADRTVHLALLVSRLAMQQSGWGTGLEYGINFGSSRGATHLWESFFTQWTDHGKIPAHASPMTTLGNLSSWIGHYFNAQGPVFSHSITCSTALNAVLNAVAWIEAGRCDRFLVGGSEAPLTSFTLAQMQALRLVAMDPGAEFPCRALDPAKTNNSMVLGEGATAICLEKKPNAPLAWIVGVGFGTEPITSPTGISSEGACLYRSMKMAIEDAANPRIDAIVTHAPGTLKGDAAERAAIERLFSKQVPLLANNKWKIGHTLGASGGLSLELAVLLLRQQYLPSIPYITQSTAGTIHHVLVNALGFGGNAVSIVIRQAD